MADIIHALSDAVKENGLLAVLIVAILCAAGFIVYWNKKLVDQITAIQATTIKENTLSMNANTVATQNLANQFRNWGSDPLKLCRFEAGSAEKMLERAEKVVEDLKEHISKTQRRE